MSPLVGIIFVAAAFVAYASHLWLVRFFYERSFRERPRRKPLWEIGSEYSGITSWCVQEGTMPKWVLVLGRQSVLVFIVGCLWVVISLFV